MPKLSPVAIQEVLKTARTETAKKSLKEILESELPVEEIVSTVAELCRDSGNNATRLRAAEMGAKLHGIMKNDEAQTPVVNIIFKDSSVDMNNILMPRQS